MHLQLLLPKRVEKGCGRGDYFVTFLLSLLIVNLYNKYIL